MMKHRMSGLFYSFILTAALIFLAGVPQAFAGALAELEQELTALVETVKPGIVIVGKLPAEVAGLEGADALKKLPKNVVPSGTGILISRDGAVYVLTNHHVTGDMAKENSVLIQLADGRRYFAKMVGADRRTDLAVVKIDTSEVLPYLTLSNVSPRQGQLVVAVGHPLGFTYSATLGIVSAVDRYVNSPFVTFIQTDAAINPGNSGGPLFNIKGEVIGINSMVMNMAQNIGFAIPVSVINKVVPQLIASGKVSRGYLGVEMNEVANAERPGFSVVVKEVRPGSPAEKAGIQKDDVLVRLNGKKVESMMAVFSVITDLPPGARVTAEVLRPTGIRFNTQIMLGEMPEK